MQNPPYTYTFSGLLIHSEIHLPELLTPTCENSFDVKIKNGVLPDSLESSNKPNRWMEVRDNEVLLKIPDVACFLIRAGNEIIIHKLAYASDADMRLYLLGSAFGALFLQRGDFPLHASVLKIGENAVAFVGESGTGKSTLAGWLNRTYPLLSDDVCVIRFDVNNIPYAYPNVPRVKLRRDALEAFGVNTRGLQRDYTRNDKYHLFVNERFHNHPIPIGCLNILEFSENLTSNLPIFDPISAAESVCAIRDNTYRVEYISAMGLTRKHYLYCVRLARQIKVQRFLRSRGHNAMPCHQKILESEFL